MKKTNSRRDFIGNSLKGLAGICLLGLVGCSKKEQLEEKFWETKEYNKTLKKIYQLAKKTRPENSSGRNRVIVMGRIMSNDSYEHNPDMINRNENFISMNYRPSLHALKRTLKDYEAEIAAIKSGGDTTYVSGSFYKH